MKGSSHRTPWRVFCVFTMAVAALSCGGRSPREQLRHPTGPVAAALPECGGALLAARDGTRIAAPMEDPAVRQAAQRGLKFLGEDTLAWQTQHQCYGCHVQAVTFDAFVVGREHHYEVPDEHFDEVLRGLLDINGGGRTEHGFSVGGSPNHLVETSRSFGGAAMAEYDEHVASDLEPVLLRAAEELLAYQNPDGSVQSTDRRPPVVAGEMQSTTQAARTWRQAYARTADDRWLAPIAKAEQYIRGRATQLTDGGATYLQDLNYAIIGLLAAGASSGEAVVETLSAELRRRQSDDGGWAFTEGGAADAFATGQSLYVLKRLGASDRDAAVSRGLGWLLEHQQSDGSWSTGGDRRGEAMWAVLGMVSVDVLSVEVAGLEDGSRLDGPVELSASALDADGNAAQSVEVRVDDVPIGRACRGAVATRLDPAQLETGAHRVDVIAQNARGQQSRRRLTFYTGDHFLTRVGTRFEGGATVFSLRNVAGEAGGTVRLRVYAGHGEARGALVQEVSQAGTPGAMTLRFDGASGASGASRETGGTREASEDQRFTAELAYVDDAGRARHEVDLPFVHLDPSVLAQRFGQVAGRIDFAEEDMEGATVELVDERGNVVRQTQSTRSGRYRFQGVDQGNYRVRVRRRGLGVREAEVQAAPAQAVDADLSF